VVGRVEDEVAEYIGVVSGVYQTLFFSLPIVSRVFSYLYPHHRSRVCVLPYVKFSVIVVLRVCYHIRYPHYNVVLFLDPSPHPALILPLPVDLVSSSPMASSSKIQDTSYTSFSAPRLVMVRNHATDLLLIIISFILYHPFHSHSHTRFFSFLHSRSNLISYRFLETRPITPL